MSRRASAVGLCVGALCLSSLIVLAAVPPTAPASAPMVAATVERIVEPAAPEPARPVLRLDTVPVELIPPITMLAPTSSWVLPAPAPSGLWGMPFAPEGLDDCASAEFYRLQWQLPDQFVRITFRESRCINREDVRTSCCVSRYQLYVSLHLRNDELALRYEACQVFDEFDIDGPQPIEQQRAACATRALFDVAGMSPWSTS